MTAEDNVELHTPLQEIEFESCIDQYFRISTTTRQKKTDVVHTHDTTHLYSHTTHYVPKEVAAVLLKHSVVMSWFARCIDVGTF